MRWLGKLCCTVIIVIIVLIIVCYFLVLSPLGMRIINWQLAKIPNNTIHIGHIDHNIMTPFEIELHDVEWQKTGFDLQLNQVSLGLKSIFDFHDLRFIKASFGHITLNHVSSFWSSHTDLLQLSHVDVDFDDGHMRFGIKQLSGGILDRDFQDPFAMTNTTFKFNAQTATWNKLSVQNMLVIGKITNKNIIFEQMGGDISKGSFSGRITYTADKQWVADELFVNGVKLYSPKSIQDGVLPYYSLIPDVFFKRLLLTNIDLDTANVKVSGLSSDIRQVSYRHNHWLSQHGEAQVFADDVIFDDEHIQNLNTRLMFSDQGIHISAFDLRWRGGLVSANGDWSLHHELTLNSLTFAGLTYVLPKDWVQWDKIRTSDWLTSLRIHHLNIMPSLLINIDPLFPFQFTGFSLSGKDLWFIRNHQLGLYQGTIQGGSDSATLRTVNITYPSFYVKGQVNNIKVTNTTAMLNKGIVALDCTLFQNPIKIQQLKLTANQVPTDFLAWWYLQKQSASQMGNVDYHVKRNQPGDSLNGELIIDLLSAGQIVEKINQ